MDWREYKGLAPATVKQALVLLKHILNFGAKRDLCAPINISTLHFEMPKLNNMRTEDVNKDQLTNLLSILENDPN